MALFGNAEMLSKTNIQ